MSELARLGLLDPRFKKADPNTIPGKQYYYGNMYKGPVIQPTPRNQVLGPLADAANYTIPKAISSVPDLLNEISYGEMPYTGTGLTTTVDPRVADFADFMPGKAALTGVGVVGSTIGKKAFSPFTKKMSRAEAEAMGLWHPISSTKLTRPFKEMTSTVEEIPGLLPTKNVSPEYFYGGVGISTKGDRTNVGRLLDINGVPLGPEGLLLEGGYKFMNANPDAQWASHLSHIKQYANKVDDIVHNQGKKAFLVGTPATHKATNFNTMMSDAYLLQINNSPITKKTIKEFDKKVREKRPEWLGLEHPKAQEQLHGNGELRHAFNRTVELKEFQLKGMPDQASTRKALTDPELYDSPNLSAGYRIGEVQAGKNYKDGSNIITNPRYPHSSYNAQIKKADNPVTTQVQFDFEDFFPTFISERRAAGKLPQDDPRSIELSKPIQVYDQQWLDHIMPIYEKKMKIQGLL
jgi:hypothetical protein